VAEPLIEMIRRLRWSYAMDCHDFRVEKYF